MLVDQFNIISDDRHGIDRELTELTAWHAAAPSPLLCRWALGSPRAEQGVKSTFAATGDLPAR